MKRVSLLFIAIAVAVFLLVSCSKKPLSSNPTENPKFDVDVLFDYDGCRVYRFYDKGYPVYFVRCGRSIQISWNEPHSLGKTHYVIPKQVVTETN